MRKLSLLLLLAAVGCGDDPSPQVTVTNSSSHVRTTPRADYGLTRRSAPRPQPLPVRASRELPQNVLGITPQQAFQDGLRGLGSSGVARRLMGCGALALSVQLRAKGVPVRALELCIVALHRAHDSAKTHEGPLSSSAHANLERQVARQTRGHALLKVWMAELIRHVESHDDLDRALAFCVRTLQVWRLDDHLRKASG